MPFFFQTAIHFLDLLTSRAQRARSAIGASCLEARSAIVKARASERVVPGPFNEKRASDFEKVYPLPSEPSPTKDNQ